MFIKLAKNFAFHQNNVLVKYLLVIVNYWYKINTGVRL